MKYLRNCLHHTSAVPQPFLLLIAANLALAGCLGWKWSLWSVPAWLAVQQSKAVFFLILYVSINDMKYFQKCLHHNSAVPQPFLLLIAANLAITRFLGWKWSLWPVPAWLALQRSKAVFYLTLYDIINDMKHFRTVCITPQPCHSHFCCRLLPIWPKLDVYTINDMKHFRTLYITPHPTLVYFHPYIKRLLEIKSPLQKMYALY